MPGEHKHPAPVSACLQRSRPGPGRDRHCSAAPGACQVTAARAGPMGVMGATVNPGWPAVAAVDSGRPAAVRIAVTAAAAWTAAAEGTGERVSVVMVVTRL